MPSRTQRAERRARGGGKKKKHLDQVFVFKHYAGPVEYLTSGFLEKSSDKLQQGLADLGASSKNKLMKALFKGKGDSKANKKTLGAQFREQLNELMGELEATQPHFVRCIKPNEEKRGNIFTAKMVNLQLRYAGVLEVCRIRKLGYPIRKTFYEFASMYRVLSGAKIDLDGKSKQVKKRAQLDALVKDLEKQKVLVKGEYQVGSNKIFLRDDQFDKLELEREKSLVGVVTVLQKKVRRFLVLKRFARWQAARAALQKAIKKRDVSALESALVGAGALPYGGRHLQEVEDARNLIDKLKEEARIVEWLESATESMDGADIKQALKAADQSGLSSSHKAVKAAKNALKDLETKKAVQEQLRQALDQGSDVAALKSAIDAAKKAKLVNMMEFRDASTLYERLVAQKDATEKLQKAISKKDVKQIKVYMNQLAELGQKDSDLVKTAQEVVQEQAKASAQIEAEQDRLIKELKDAVGSKNLAKLDELEQDVYRLGLEDHNVVKEALALRAQLALEKELTSDLEAEMRAATQKAESANGVSEKDIASVQSAVEQVKASGGDLDASDKIRQAEQLINKLDNQLQVQNELKKVVEKAKDKQKLAMIDELRENLKDAQALGIDTPAARKIKDWVATAEQEIASREKDAMRQKRKENREKLVEATKEELEDYALQRLAMLATEDYHALQEKARDTSVYAVKKFYKIRSDEEYIAALPKDERDDQDLADIIANKLHAQTSPLHVSLLLFGEDRSKTATRINRAILQYCGDLTTSFPASLAQFVLGKGLEDPEMCDEIYLQLCKHTTDNPRAESADRAWLLTCMASKTFPPTDAFAPYLINFWINCSTRPGLVGNYARLCIVQLDASIALGASSFRPNLEDIQLYRKRPPVLAPIHMCDGKLVQFPVTPDLRVGNVVEMIKHQQEISDEDLENMGLDLDTPVWGIFVKDGNENGKRSPRERLVTFYKKYNPAKLKFVDQFLEHWKDNEEELFAKLVDKYGPEPEADGKAKKTGGLSLPITKAMNAVKMLGLTSKQKAPPTPTIAWPLPWWAHLGDVVLRMNNQRKQPVFYFKRRMILDGTGKDENLFHQLQNDVMSGEIVFRNAPEAAEAALISVVLKTKDLKPPKNPVESLPKVGITDYMAPHWRHNKSAEDWARVAMQLPKLPRTKAKLMDQYIKLCQKSQTYGMSFFTARRSDKPKEEYTIGIDAQGIHFLQATDRGQMELVDTIAYDKIVKYGATVEYFWANINTKQKQSNPLGFGSSGVNVLLYTLQSWELYETVFDYTHTEYH